MPGKLPKTPFLITSSLTSSNQKTTTSFIRQSDDLFTTGRLLFISVILLIFFSFTAYGNPVLRGDKAMITFKTKETAGNLINFGDSSPDSDLVSSPTIYGATKIDDSKLSNFLKFENFFRSMCHGLSYQKCIQFRQLAKKWSKTKFNPTHHESSITNAKTVPPVFNKDTFDLSTNTIKEEKSSSSQEFNSEYPLVKTRQKRLASGDRRLVYLICRTNFVLEIQEDGKVVGNPVRSQRAALEIQTVAKDGMVRFYSPATNYFLAMDNRGRLYGTKTYTEEHCAFTERVQLSQWSTYSTQILPKKKKQKHRSKRSADRVWYVAIGKTGKPRKASRIRPSQNSAQFLPRPIN